MLAKITDFGFATFALSVFEADGPLYREDLYIHNRIQLTDASYWSSPNRHERGYTYEEAVLEEVYSFGMTCFWTVFNHLTAFPGLEQVQAAKVAGKMPELCFKLAEDPELGATYEQIKTLKQLFSITLAVSSDDRSTVSAIVDLLGSGNAASESNARRTFDIAPIPGDSAMSIIDYHLIPSLTQLLAVDFRVRKYVRHCMEMVLEGAIHVETIERTHYELACCFHLGFGGARDLEKRDYHLLRTNSSLDEIERQIRTAMEVKGIVYFKGQFRTSLESGLVPPLDIVQSFRDVPATSDLPDLMREEVESMERALGPTSTHIIHMKANLANLLWEQGQVQPARTMLRQCLEVVDAGSNADAWDLIFLKGQVAEAELRVGHWREAESLCRKALEDAVELGGDNSGEVVVLKNQLSLTLHDLGRWSEASVLQREIVDYQRNHIGPKHPITLQMTSSLIQMLIELGEYEEAEQLINHVRELRLSVWGPDSQDTLLSLMDEARLLETRGDIDGAEALERQALNRCRRSLEKDHPYTLDCMMNLANSLVDRAQMSEATELAEQCVEAYIRVRGERHPDTLRSKTSLAMVYRECGRYKEARTLNIEVYEQLDSLLGPTHPFTLENMHHLATCHWKFGDPILAEDLFVRVVEARSYLLGKDHRETLISRTMLAVLFAEQGKTTEAIEMAEVILASSREALGSSHRDTLTAATNLASYYDDADDILRAIALEEETLATAESNLDPDDSIILITKQNLATSYMNPSVKRYDEGLAMAESAVAMRAKPDIDDPEGLSNAQSILAQIYARLGRYDEAAELYKRVLATRVELFSEDHPDTMATAEAIQALKNTLVKS